MTIVPSYFTGTKDEDNPDNIVTGNFEGYGGAAGFSYGFSERLGVYGWSIGSSLSGTFAMLGKRPGNTTDIELRNSQSSVIMLSAGVVYQFWGDEGDPFTASVFYGPTLARPKFRQTVFSSQLDADFDMELSPTLFGLLSGVQGGVDAGKHFRLNPFMITGASLGNRCHRYDVPSIRRDGQGVSQQSTSECVGLDFVKQASGRLIGVQPWVFVVGLNLIYKPWGLSVNVTAPILKRNPLMRSTTSVAIFSASWSFGSYTR